MADTKASSGHKLGQLIGDWFEEYFVWPLLNLVAENLDLYVDTRFKNRIARESKILWKDYDDNSVDYDLVLELGGTDEKIGIPVAFIECFWRRGSRHSKDKARDDSGKLLPMRDTYPTARFLGIVAAGDFTSPAKTLLRSREIDLFYVSKEKIVQAFSACGLVVDYPDKLDEDGKATIVNNFESLFTEQVKKQVVNSLIDQIGKSSIESYIDSVKAALRATPQEIRIVLRHTYEPITFNSILEASEFLSSPEFKKDLPIDSYLYQITYNDGTEFDKSVDTVEELRSLHDQIVLLTDHMNNLSSEVKF